MGLAFLALAAYCGTSVPAAASTASLSGPSTGVLLPLAAAQKAGFTKVIDAPATSRKTGVSGCPYGAQEELASASGKLRLVTEVLYCTTTARASAVLRSSASAGKGRSGLSPPSALGSSAVERVESDSTYIIYWQRDAALELIALTTDVPASSSTSTTSGSIPITAHQQDLLDHAAIQQNARFKNVHVS
jgi:hypothetical protein